MVYVSSDSSWWEDDSVSNSRLAVMAERYTQQPVNSVLGFLTRCLAVQRAYLL